MFKLASYSDFINEMNINRNDFFKYTKITDNKYVFSTDVNKYIVSFIKLKDDAVEVEYYLDTDNENDTVVTNENIPFKILTTVFNIISEYINKNEVKKIIWGSSSIDSKGNYNSKKSAQRQGLYLLFINIYFPGKIVHKKGNVFYINLKK